MDTYHKELLMELISKWNDDQLQGYIYDVEQRLEHTRSLLSDLKALQKKRSKKKPLNNRFQGE
jgi:hypothetical protein